MDEPSCLELSRFGDHVRYEIDGFRLLVRGRHLVGSRYELSCPLGDLRPDYQTFWLKNSRPATQVVLIATFLILFFASVAAAVLWPAVIRAHGLWFLAVLALSCWLFGQRLRAPRGGGGLRVQVRRRGLSCSTVGQVPGPPPTLCAVTRRKNRPSRRGR
jgi:hypothetical protein